MVMAYLKKILYIIFISKKDFKLPKKNKIIFLDEIGYKKIRDSLLENLEFTIINLRYAEINVPILLLSLINVIKYGKHCYKITFIKYVNAKFAFSFIDTSLHYCDLIEKIPDCKLILIQNGRRQGKELEPFIHRVEDKFKSDYYFVFNKEYAEYVQRYISTKFVVGGSILNNRYQKAEFISKVEKVQYISEFHVKESVPDIDYEKWEIEPTKFTLEILNEFCKKNNLELEIIGRIFDSERERNFYQQFNIPFKFTKKTKENYSKLSNSSIIVGMSSTMLGESFSRYFRVAFFDIRNDFYLQNHLKPGFAFPKKTNEHGEFWSNKPNKNKMLENLDFLYSVDESDWSKLVEKWSDSLVVYDYGNNKYKKILKQESVI